MIWFDGKHAMQLSYLSPSLVDNDRTLPKFTGDDAAAGGREPSAACGAAFDCDDSRWRASSASLMSLNDP